MPTTHPYRFDAERWLLSAEVRRMTLEERGALVELMAYAWRGDGLDGDDRELARLLGVTPRRWAKMRDRVLAGWTENSSGRLVEPRLETERARLAAWREKSARGGAARAQAAQAPRKPAAKSGTSKQQANSKQAAKGGAALNNVRTAPDHPTGDPSRASVAPAPTLIAAWVERWSRRYPGERYVVQGGQAGASLKRLDAALGRDELLARMDRYLANADPFYTQQRHDLGVFVAQINRHVAPQAATTAVDTSGIAAFVDGKGAAF